jgi:hypothetical protein
MDELLLDMTAQLQLTLAGQGAEVAHLKSIGLGETSFGVANLVASTSPPELSLPSRANVREMDLIVNARVACDPADLEQLVRGVVSSACEGRAATVFFHTVQSFRPGRPQPTHRYSEAVSTPPG